MGQITGDTQGDTFGTTNGSWASAKRSLSSSREDVSSGPAFDPAIGKLFSLMLKSAAPNFRPFTARTLVAAQQQTLLAELLQHHFNLVVLELDDLLLAFVSSVNEGVGSKN